MNYLTSIQTTCVIAMLFCSGNALAGVTDEPYLNIVQKTEAESARITKVLEAPTDFTVPSTFESMTAGAATVRARSDEHAFSQPSASMKADDRLTFKLGNAMFEKLWVTSPASTKASDGLGPIYNARSCNACHLNDGRGHAPDGPEDRAVSLVLRVSIPGRPEDQISQIEDYIATRPDPNYGEQLQDFANPAHDAEYRLEVTYQQVTVPLSEGETATLRQPNYNAKDLAYGALHTEAMLSPRMAPQLIGLGLLESIPAADILANADPDDRNGDGISGRANIVWSRQFDQPLLGRFGWKAGLPTLREQTAAAFAGDMGISSALFPGGWGDCTPAQGACRGAIHGDGDVREHELDDTGLDLTTFYTANLAVPERRTPGDPQVLKGKQVFHRTGCAACHTPAFVTHRLKDRPEHSFQLIWPYTDLLLHDMGDGLADNRPEARANGKEWRTPPLWGIGLTKQVSGRVAFLHDGRARSLLEAILWHGGEAQPVRDKVVTMPAADRRALIHFLESL
ncbi:hypothetical protein ATO10_08067 [Actibacterium atlanticum]|uniref:Cytochrome c domain-containing protein n=1 Tax=Actibacterium atlanticum TaxID=1461693 RepID=A0A058ZM81_9RHOB|nr:hypothetical protein ATO10_08067 [Actibacterium atlanticum]